MTSSKQRVFTSLTVNGATKAHEFYKAAFDATIGNIFPAEGDDGRLMHSEVTLFGSIVYVADAFPEFSPDGPKSPLDSNGTTGTVNIRFDTPEELTKVFKQAKDAGAKVEMEPVDQFWGDCYASLIDPFGHRWSFCAEISEERTKKAAAAEEARKKQPPTKKPKVEEKPIIKGVHSQFYSANAPETRSFLKDVFGFESRDLGEGWLLFKCPGAEMGVNKVDTKKSPPQGTHEISFLTENIEQAMEKLKEKGYECSTVKEECYGKETKFQLPGVGEVQLYQANY